MHHSFTPLLPPVFLLTLFLLIESPNRHLETWKTSTIARLNKLPCWRRNWPVRMTLRSSCNGLKMNYAIPRRSWLWHRAVLKGWKRTRTVPCLCAEPAAPMGSRQSCSVSAGVAVGLVSLRSGWHHPRVSSAFMACSTKWRTSSRALQPSSQPSPNPWPLTRPANITSHPHRYIVTRHHQCLATEPVRTTFRSLHKPIMAIITRHPQHQSLQLQADQNVTHFRSSQALAREQQRLPLIFIAHRARLHAAPALTMLWFRAQQGRRVRAIPSIWCQASP